MPKPLLIAATFFALGLGATAADSSASRASVQRGRHTEVVVYVSTNANTLGVLRVYRVHGSLVARQTIRYDHQRFRFVLRPGRYKLAFTGGVIDADRCPFSTTISVGRTTLIHYVSICRFGEY